MLKGVGGVRIEDMGVLGESAGKNFNEINKRIVGSVTRKHFQHIHQIYPCQSAVYHLS